LAIAVATSWAKFANRDSVSGGGSASWRDWKMSRPHSRPSTTIGLPTEWRAWSRSRASRPSSPPTCDQSSTRADSPVAATFADRLPGTIG
jgi:hypothetical protein